MSELNPECEEQLDYPFLLVSHMILADRQVHLEESKALRQLARRIKVGDRTSEEMEKICDPNRNPLSLETVAKMVPEEQRISAMRQTLAIAHIDGHFSSLEREMAEQIAQIWNWPTGQLEQLFEEAAGLNEPA